MTNHYRAGMNSFEFHSYAPDTDPNDICPHGFDTWQAREWHAGWQKAKREYVPPPPPEPEPTLWELIEAASNGNESLNKLLTMLCEKAGLE